MPEGQDNYCRYTTPSWHITALEIPQRRHPARAPTARPHGPLRRLPTQSQLAGAATNHHAASIPVLGPSEP